MPGKFITVEKERHSSYYQRSGKTSYIDSDRIISVTSGHYEGAKILFDTGVEMKVDESSSSILKKIEHARKAQKKET